MRMGASVFDKAGFATYYEAIEAGKLSLDLVGERLVELKDEKKS